MLLEGPGVVMVEHAFRAFGRGPATRVFRTLLDEERATGKDRGDYFAKPGTNERLWDSLGKLAFRDPEVFVDYFANDMVALVSVATRLGSATRSPRRSTWSTRVARPRRCTETIIWVLHPTSAPSLSLRTSTNSLRYSHLPGRRSALRHARREWAYPVRPLLPEVPARLPGVAFATVLRSWKRTYVQPPLAKGDAMVFFNPALFHGAGQTGRLPTWMYNLLQISSTFGRAMESVDRDGITNAVFPALLQRKRQGADEA